MQEKIKIRSNLSNHDLKHIELSSDMIEKLEELITQKIVCTYIPIASEINILPSLTSLASLNTTMIEGGWGHIKLGVKRLGPTSVDQERFTSSSARDGLG